MWLSNDESYYDDTRSMAGRGLCAGALAEQLREYVDELPDVVAVTEGPASFVCDLLGAALGSVDWYELAENLLAPDEYVGEIEQRYRVGLTWGEIDTAQEALRRQVDYWTERGTDAPLDFQAECDQIIAGLWELVHRFGDARRIAHGQEPVLGSSDFEALL